MADATITGISPGVVDMRGGMAFVLSGTFTPGAIYRVFMGTLGTVADPPCYSGVSGRGTSCISADGATLQAVAPAVAIGAASPQLVTVSLVGGTEPVSCVITVIESGWHGTVFNVRRSFPPVAGVGARRLELEANLTLQAVIPPS